MAGSDLRLLLVPGTCYIGEPDGHLTLTVDLQARLISGQRDSLRNRTLDTLFNSVATFASERSIAIILSCSLDDGCRGFAAVHAAQGLTMVLDPRGKWPPGMQQNAINYNASIDFIGTARNIAEKINLLTTEAYIFEDAHGG